MEVDPERLKALAPKLRDHGSIPPREAVFTLLALAGEDPEDLVTLSPGSSSWQLTALGHGGLTVVEVDFGSSDWWSWERDRRPEDAKVSGRWYPLSAVRSIEPASLRVWQGSFLDSGLTLNGMTGYSIHIAGREAPVVLAEDPSNREGAVRAFISTLQRQLG
ncbi:MAG: hypothetical protein ACR2FG_07940 [Marmoricola sp.]